MMEGDKLIINSNNSCLMCFEKVGEAKPDYQQSDNSHMKYDSYFPLHKLTHKLNLDLGIVFPDVVSCFGEDSSQRLGQLQLFCDLCKDCSDNCNELEKEMPSGDLKGHAKVLIDKMTKVELLGQYDRETKPVGLIHFGIVDRLRKELMAMLSQLQVREKRKQSSPNPGRPSKKRKVDGNLSQIVTRSMAAQKGGEFINRNPFENDIVISNILSFLKIKDVKRCRFINKQWNNNGYRIIKQKVADAWIDLQFKETTKLKLLDKILCFLESGSQLPLASKVSIDTTFLEVTEDEENLLRFFNAVAPKLTKLNVVSCGMDNGYDISYPEGLIFSHLVSIDFFLSYDSVGYTHFEVFRKIVLNAPQLKEIRVGAAAVKPASTFQPLVDLLTDRHVKNHLTSLIITHQSCLPSNNQYHQLAEIGMTLKKLQIKPVEQNVVGVSHFLKSQSESLKELNIDFGTAQFKIPMMPMMPKLKVLKLSGNDGESGKVWNWKRISYKKLFPCLEYLRLETIQEGDLDIFLHSGRCENDIGHSVKKLTISLINQTPSSHHIENAANLFPNLTNLEISAELEMLLMVYARMRKLQELTLDCNEYDMCNYETIDNLLMGLEPSTTDCHCFCGKCDIYFNFDPDASLLALTELKTLRIRSFGYPNTNIIGDNVCRHVLMKMKSLKLVKFYGVRGGLARTGISNLMFDEMRKRMVVLATACWDDKNM